ncbi:MAG: 23S rRNA (pseudouridine(1915)-N(3))-methyltransferase RlmH [Clostridia bacterium]
MKIRIVCVGNLKEQYWRDAESEYKKRLSRFCDIDIVQLPEKNNFSSKDLILKNESADIIKNLQGYNIVLDLGGETFSSEEFSLELDKIKLSGEGKITFVIGSSYGLHDSVKALANKKMSFSKMTFPHQMARVVLLEQIYRAFCISNNISYHK